MIFINSSETVFNSVFEIKLQQGFLNGPWRTRPSMSKILTVWKSWTLIFPLTKFSMKSAPQNRFENRKNAVYCPLLPIALLFDSLPLTTTRDVIESKPKYFGFILFVPDQISTSLSWPCKRLVHGYLPVQIIFGPLSRHGSGIGFWAKIQLFQKFILHKVN